MQTVVATPPEALLTAATVRARLGLPADVVDDTIDALVAAATGVIDGPPGWLGRCLGKQTLELQAEFFPGCGFPFADGAPAVWRAYAANGGYDPTIRLSCPPIISVDSITYIDGGGAEQTLDAAAYVLSGRYLTPAYGLGWPTSRQQPDAVRIRYTAGYDDGKVPAPILQAIVMGVAKLNGMMKADPALSQETVIGVSSMQWQVSADMGDAYDKAANMLLAPFRVFD